MFAGVEIPIVLVDDEKILRYGLKMALEGLPGVRIIGEAKDGQEAVEVVARLRPAIVFMDIRMPVMSGIEATALIKKRVPETRIIMFTSNNDEETFRLALSAGADAYCLKDSSEQQLLGAMHAVLQGAKWLDSKLACDLFHSAASSVAPVSGFSTNQRRILDLLDQGHELNAIASQLGVEVTSIKYQMQDILKRLQAAEPDDELMLRH